MKNNFGNNRNKDLTDDNITRRDNVYNDSDKGMTDVNRTNRESMTNVEGDSVYNDRNKGMTTRVNSDEDKVLAGIFDTENEAVNVIRRLKEIGYHEDDITVVAKDKDKMERLENRTDVDTKTHGDTDKMGAGAAIGGTLGGIAAALPALGLLTIPGIGPILAAGPIVGILGGIVAGGVAGGLVGALVELGVEEEAAKHYEYQMNQGKIVVLVENREHMRDEVNTTYRQNNSVLYRNPPQF